MIGYITLATNDLQRAARFYDALLGEFGARRYFETERGISVSPDRTSLALMKPFDGKAATVGNGVMVALGVPGRESIDALYEKAIQLGATDEGRARPHGAAGFYAGYFRDPDGNKLNVFCIEPKL